MEGPPIEGIKPEEDAGSLTYHRFRVQASMVPSRRSTSADYRGIVHNLEIQQRALQTNDRVLLVDDWAEEGSQAMAAKRLIEQRSARFLGLAVMVDQLSDAKRSLLGEVRSIVRAAELPTSS